MMLFQGNEKLGISHSFMKSSLIVGFILQNPSIKRQTLYYYSQAFRDFYDWRLNSSQVLSIYLIEIFCPLVRNLFSREMRYNITLAHCVQTSLTWISFLAENLIVGGCWWGTSDGLEELVVRTYMLMASLLFVSSINMMDHPSVLPCMQKWNIVFASVPYKCLDLEILRHS